MSQDGPARDLSANFPATFWGVLDAEDQRVLRAAGTVRAFAPGARLCREGQQPGRVFVIYSGEVEVFRDDPDGHRTVLARRGPGDIIGELSAIDGRPMSATVSAVDSVVSLVLGASKFAEICRTTPRIAWFLLRNVVTPRLRDSDIHRARYRADVRHRTIACLLELAEAEAQRHPAARPVVLTVTQQALADMVSASLISVTRVLQELRGRGALSTGRGRISVHDAGLLRRLLPADPY